MISKSMFRNHGKATLPSADSWYMSHTIIKDPPKAIHTRRIDKVGDTSLITRQIDDAGDRISECILQFPRGQNPMVGTNYNNFQAVGRNQNQLAGRRQAFLPYRVAVNGAFQPPVQTPTDLLPLSRMPRNWTQAITNPNSVDFTRRLIDQCPSKDMRQIKQNVLQPDVHSTAIFSLERPSDGFDTLGKVHKKTLLKGSADGRVFKLRDVDNVVLDTSKYINADISKGSAEGRAFRLTEVDNIILDTSKYINADIAKGSAESKVCWKQESTGPTPHMRYRDPLPIDMQSNASGVSGSRNAILDPNYKLPPRLDLGGFVNAGSVPSFEKTDINYVLGDGKMNLQMKAHNLQFEAGV